MIDYDKVLINYVEKTQKSRELFQYLNNAYEDPYNLGDETKRNTFIVVFINCNTEEKQQQMIDILKRRRLNSSDIIKTALQIHYGKTPEISEA